MMVIKRLNRKWIFILAPLFLLTACAGTVIEPTQAIELTATIAIPATSTETPEPTPEPTPTADPLAGYENIELSQEFNGGGSMAYLKDGEVLIKDSNGVELTPNEQGLYAVDGIFWAWIAEEGKMEPAIKLDEEGRVQIWDKYYRYVYSDQGRVVAESLVQSESGAVVLNESGQATAMVIPGQEKAVLPNYDGLFPVPDKPGFFYSYDTQTGIFKEEELGTREGYENFGEYTAKMFDEVKMVILGKVVPFKIATDVTSDIRPIWKENWSVVDFKVNPNLEDPAGKFSRMVQAVLWHISEAGRARVPYEDYMANSDLYVINTIPGVSKFKLSDLNEVKYVYLEPGDERLSYDNGWGANYGFDFDEEKGILTVFGTTNPDDPQLQDEVLDKGVRKYRGRGYEQVLGDQFGVFMHVLINLYYPGDEEIVELGNEVKDIIGTRFNNIGGAEGYARWAKINGLWMVVDGSG